MTQAHATSTTTRPDEDQPVPARRRRSLPRPAWRLTGLVGVAALAVAGVLTLAGHDGSAPVDERAVRSVVVDAAEPVHSDDDIVTTACFSYRVPEGLELDRQSAGCSTAVGFGSDSLTQIQVRAQTGDLGTDRGDLAAAVRQSLVDAGVDGVDVDVLTVDGRDAARLRSVDSWGIRRTSYVVPLPPGRFTQAGKDLGSIWLTGPSSPEFDAWMATVLGSLEIPGD
ncbi:hypothetical protein [Cellulomonas sp. URHE0023]|uniref:hypothetical protein n=1 Tax=Cellulomonas sp. URHE0023 TaxID=1380354 RepID=UPI000489D1A3|nr:hypothetical protein [Cellulomonas sp. URHE0023]